MKNNKSTVISLKKRQAKTEMPAAIVDDFDAYDFMEDLQELAIAQRFKRLSEQFNQGQSLLYQMQKIPFEPAWFSLFYLLTKKSQLSLIDISEHLQITHSAVSQLVTELVKKGYLAIDVDGSDKRKKLVTLTKTGKVMTTQLIPVWKEMKVVFRELMISTGYDILDVLGKLERLLEDYPLSNRLYDSMLQQQTAKVQVVGYQPQYKVAFERLNRQWLEKYFFVEPIDALYFAEPEKEIIAKGGFIFFALLEGEVVGTCALIPSFNDCDTFELGKMAVDDKMQGRHIGELLLTTAINTARETGKTNLYLEMNSQFVRSVQLYRKLGFTLAPFDNPPKYKRSDSVLKLSL